MITIRYQDGAAREERRFPTIRSARKWCGAMMTRPVTVHTAYGYAIDPYGLTVVAVDFDIADLFKAEDRA